jgi:hypothetical protein
VSTGARPAFYALAPGGWRDLWTLLHPPYTLWHLSYVAIGAALAPTFHGGLLLATLAAFFLGMGIGAHALDELHDRPLGTRVSDRALAVAAAVSLLGACAIGIVVALRVDLWLLAFVAAGAFVAAAYNLELFGGRLHGDAWFALSWGAFPLLTAYFASARRLSWEALAAAAFAALLSHAQRVLSTPVRTARRRVASLEGTVEFRDGTTEALDARVLLRTPERALQVLAAAIVTLAAALVLGRLT